MSTQTASEKITKELRQCLKDGNTILTGLNADEPEEGFSFAVDYQQFYSNALRIVEILGPDRAAEFRSYYEIDPKRKTLGYGTYVIQDFLKNVAPNAYSHAEFDTTGQVTTAVFNQLTIIKSLETRIEGVLSDVTGGLRAEIQDAELETAKTLLKTSLRAGGALAGVILEGHLQGVCATHKVTMRKKHPTISDLNDPLKAAGVYGTPDWRKISYLADLRNTCCHKKGDDPTKDQVEELIEGVNWAIKTIV